MSTQTLIGKDSLSINDNLITDLAEGVVTTLTHEGDLTAMTAGKNGNVIVTLNENGKIAMLTLRVIVGSANDIYFNSLKTLMENDLASFPMMYGSWVKRIGDGKGKVKRITLNLNGGVFAKNIDSQDDSAGGVEQGVAVYTIRFAGAPRVIG